MNRDDYQKGIRSAFGGSKEDNKKKKPKSTYQERTAARLAKMTPEEVAERQRKIDSQRGMEDGGICKERDKKNKLEALAKLSKSRK